MIRSKIVFDLPMRERATMPVAKIPTGVYFIGTLVSVDPKSYGNGFDAVKNQGVFYRLSSRITFLETDNEVNSRGGREWPDRGYSSFTSYVEDFEEVQVTVNVRRAV